MPEDPVELVEADVERRVDYAIFSDDRFLTNALLTVQEVERMELDGYRCLEVRDTVGEGLPRFRGRTYVVPRSRFSGRWRWD